MAPHSSTNSSKPLAEVPRKGVDLGSIDECAASDTRSTRAVQIAPIISAFLAVAGEQARRLCRLVRQN